MYRIKCISLMLILVLSSCISKKNIKQEQHIITSDIENFWMAYDKISTTQDSVLQYNYLDSLFIKKGTPGLNGIMQARNYTPKEYIDAINKYPKFWNSIRKNTLTTGDYVDELYEGIEKIRNIYPELKPAKIYFTIGALRTPGTTVDSLVLIGSELAMSDKNTVSLEFQGNVQTGRRTYFDSNPIKNIVLLNVHEYVHTQQKSAVNNLLSYALREGIAEFVSVKAMNVSSAAPAINYGKQNEAVKQKFENTMFYGNNLHHWLWSDFQNEFNTRDLGYYIGYQIAEINYENAQNKKAAIKEMIELDYTNETQIEDFVDRTNFFSKSLEALYIDFENKRPKVLGIQQFKNKSKQVSPKITEIAIEFSEALNGHHTGVDYGELGKEAFPKISDRYWSEDNTSWTLKVELEPNTAYQILISNFRTEDEMPLKPYLIDFKTTD